jgi:hypothetical protein
MKITGRTVDKLKELVEDSVREKLTGAKSFTGGTSLAGYNPIELIRGALFWWIAVPFNGVEFYCQLRCPNATQIEQCGDITNIVDPDNKKEPAYEDLLRVRNFQENLCKITFNIPTFDHIFQLVGKNDFVISEKKAELEKIKKRVEDAKDKLSAVEKEVLETRIRTLELEIGYILPNDTMNFITKWAMGHDISDIKKINHEGFLRAAALAEANGKAPSDYLSGVFTDFNKKEIDGHAAAVLADYRKDEQTVKDGKYRWFRFGRMKKK